MAAQVTELYDRGDIESARKLAHRLAPWTAAAFVESNPIPLKAALAMMGKMRNVLRLPLVPLKGSYEENVRTALAAAGALA
jgi:4-hydroxy-tetrahydrodipicolinate synthase